MKLKVWGGLTFSDGRTQVRTIVATKTKKEAAALVDVSLYHFNGYWCETGNRVEMDTALSMPGVVFCASSVMGFDFRPRTP